MSLPKILSPDFWVDKIVIIILQAVLTILQCILYVIKGEDVRITKEVTSEKLSSKKPVAEKISKDQQKNPSAVNIVTGTPSELEPEEIIKETVVPSEPHIKPILKNEPIKEEEVKAILNEVKPQEKEDKHVCPFDMRTSHGISKEYDIIPIEFHWKYGGNKVFVTGDFDGWAQKHEMHFNPDINEFVAVVEIDRTKQSQFKFVVDGIWQCNRDFPTQNDEHGNVNNILYPNPVGPLIPEYKEYVIPPFSSQMTATVY